MSYDNLDRLARRGDVSKDAVAARLLLVRETLGLTQHAMARLIGTSQSNLVHFERGNTYPKPHYVQKILEAHGIDHNFIYMGDYSSMPLRVIDALERQAHRVSQDSHYDRGAGGRS